MFWHSNPMTKTTLHSGYARFLWLMVQHNRSGQSQSSFPTAVLWCLWSTTHCNWYQCSPLFSDDGIHLLHSDTCPMPMPIISLLLLMLIADMHTVLGQPTASYCRYVMGGQRRCIRLTLISILHFQAAMAWIVQWIHHLHLPC